MADGKIIKTGGQKLAIELEENGYEWIDNKNKIMEGDQ